MVLHGGLTSKRRWKWETKFAGWHGALLSSCDSLDSKGVAAWPRHLVFSLAIGTSRYSLDFLSQSGGSDDSHSALTLFATKNFLHVPPLPDLASVEGPLLTRCLLIYHCFSDARSAPGAQQRVPVAPEQLAAPSFASGGFKTVKASCSARR